MARRAVRGREGDGLAAGARLGELELIGRLGAGGQGQVYLAWPVALGAAGGRARAWAAARLALGGATPDLAARWHLAALKVARPDQVAALYDEHSALASPAAAHPNLVALYSRRHPGVTRRDIGVARLPSGAAAHWLALAYEPGPTLAALLDRQRGQSIAWPLALAIVGQAAAAVEHMHCQLGLAHLDIKPGNLAVSGLAQASGPRAVLLDLGTADLIGAVGRRGIYGSGAYLAPERLALPPAPPAPQADIYSLGVLLRELSGPSAPAALAALVADATATDPARRRAALPDVAAFRGRLRDLPA